MLQNTLLLIIILSICSSSSANLSANASTKPMGFTAPLTPPLSPRSPFYLDILEANNITTTNTNISLNRTHYLTWFLREMSSIPVNSYGEYHFQQLAGYHVLDVYLSQPVQIVYGVFDTGSDLVWFQGVERAGKSQFPVFNQTKSRLYEPVQCSESYQCDTMNPAIKGCTPGSDLCQFNVMYQDSTEASGFMGTDMVSFKPDWSIWKMLFGLSRDNSPKMMGVIGASHSHYSLPNQIGGRDSSFSYCIPDDLSKTSYVKFGHDANLSGNSIKALRNSNYGFYYLDVYTLQVNGEDIDVNPDEFKMSPEGDKGFIIDSATTITLLPSPILSAVHTKIISILGKPEKYLMFPLCYPSWIFGIWPRKQRPKIAIKFNNNVEFEFEESRMWNRMPNTQLDCLQMFRTWGRISVLGYEQLYNINVGHHPKYNQLFLLRTTCPTEDVAS